MNSSNNSELLGLIFKPIDGEILGLICHLGLLPPSSFLSVLHQSVTLKNADTHMHTDAIQQCHLGFQSRCIISIDPSCSSLVLLHGRFHSSAVSAYLCCMSAPLPPALCMVQVPWWSQMSGPEAGRHSTEDNDQPSRLLL